MFQISIILYIVAALTSIALAKWHRLCNLAAHLLCVAASAVGAAAALSHILGGGGRKVIWLVDSAIPNISLSITVDTLSAFFLLALSILVACVSVYSIGYLSHYYGKRSVGLFNFLYSVFVLSMIFVMTAGNAVFFLISWEAMSLASYFLVVFESEKDESRRAGMLYMIMTHLGTAFLMIAFLVMFGYTGTFDLSGPSAAIPGFARNLMFVFLLIGFGTKAGVIPLHIWLPYAHPAAPSNVSALMSGIMIKTAIYGILRFILEYLTVRDTWWGVTILCAGIVSAVLGITYALVSRNIKRILAFSSIENIGIILIGVGVSFIGFASGNALLGGLALTASLLHAFNHTLFKGGLFLGAGAIQYSAHTRDIEKLGGLIRKMPVVSLLMLVFSLAVSAIVPLNGFVSEWLTYQSLFANIGTSAGMNILSILAVAALALTGALAAACFVKVYGIAFLGLPRSSHAEDAVEPPASMNAGMGILAALCLIAGLFPMLILQLADRVTVSLSGASILSGLQGGVAVVSYPVSAGAGSISPVEISAVLAVILLAALLVVRLIGGQIIIRKYGTWDCGYKALNARMQYSGTGFSKPLRIVFRMLFRPGRELETEKGRSPYFPKVIKYTVSTVSIFEKYLYDPLLKSVRNISRRVKYSVQTGSVHTYLIYIFIAVLALMLYNRLF